MDPALNLPPESYVRIIEHLHDGIYVVTPDRKIVYWNRAAEAISGFSASEVLGKSCADNILTHVDVKGRNLCLGMCPLAETIKDGESREVDLYLHHKAGHRVPVAVRVRTLTDKDGRVIGGVEIFSDLTNKQAIEFRLKELESLAFLDPLTRLANRRYLENELQVRLEEFRRFRVPFGILFMDIDHFKRINDTYGHEIGDRVLRFTAETLSRNARPFDLFARWGGEEFAGLIRNIGPAQLAELGERLRRLIAGSYLQIEGDSVRTTISVGATMIQEGDDAGAVMKRADGLLYRSKNEGRNRLTLG